MGRRNNGKKVPFNKGKTINEQKGKGANIKPSDAEAAIDKAVEEHSKKFGINGGSPRKTNDPAWYMDDMPQVNSVANIPFSESFGDYLALLTKEYEVTFRNKNFFVRRGPRTAVPGIAAIRTRPTFGYNFRITDPLNIAATELYTHVRYYNNGRKNYDPADLLIHVLAITDAYSYIEYIKKIYACAFKYSTRNFYIGKTMLAACGVNADDIIKNLPNLRYWLNTYINKVSAYIVPSTINLFKRRAFLYSDIYTESQTENIKDQLYTFIPDGFYKFAIEESTGMGMLDYIIMPRDHLVTFEDLMNIGDSLLENVTQDEDFGLMSGDLLKAFGGDVIKVDEIDETYEIIPHYDHEVLHQIMNGMIYSRARKGIAEGGQEFAEYASSDSLEPIDGRTYKNGLVYQTNKGILIHAFTLARASRNPEAPMELLWDELLRFMNVTLNTDLPTVDVGHIMEMTRLSLTRVDAPANWRSQVVGEGDDAYTNALSVLSCGSDIITEVIIYKFDDNSNMGIPGSKLSKFEWEQPYVKKLSEVEGLYTMIENAHMKGQFKYLPVLYEIQTTEGVETGEVKVNNIWHNFENYTFIDPLQLDRIHRVALYSLVHVPGAAKRVSQ